MPFSMQTCAKKDEQISELDTDRAKIVAKALKYKEQNESLQQTIAEHIQTQEELQAKLRAETKANAGETLSTLSTLSLTRQH